MPSIPEAYALALERHRAGQLREAESIYRQILATDSNHEQAWYGLGVVSYQVGNHQAAVQCIQGVLARRPNFADGHYHLGNAWKLQGKPDEAIACYQRAIELKPTFAEAYNDMGMTLRDRGMLDESMASYRRALELKRNFVDAHNNLGNAFKDVGKLDQAMAHYRRALKLKPDFAEAHNNLGNVLRDRGKLDESLASYQQALELKPQYTEAHSNYLYTTHYRPGVTLSELAALHGEFDRQHAARLRLARPLHENDRDPDRRLRLGFISRDFGWHPVGFFLIRAMENLDQSQCETICYSDRIFNDDLARGFRPLRRSGATSAGSVMRNWLTRSTAIGSISSSILRDIRPTIGSWYLHANQRPSR